METVLECVITEVAAAFEVCHFDTRVRRKAAMMRIKRCGRFVIHDVIKSLCFSSCMQFFNAHNSPNRLLKSKDYTGSGSYINLRHPCL